MAGLVLGLSSHLFDPVSVVVDVDINSWLLGSRTSVGSPRNDTGQLVSSSHFSDQRTTGISLAGVNLTLSVSRTDHAWLNGLAIPAFAGTERLWNDGNVSLDQELLIVGVVRVPPSHHSCFFSPINRSGGYTDRLHLVVELEGFCYFQNCNVVCHQRPECHRVFGNLCNFSRVLSLVIGFVVPVGKHKSDLVSGRALLDTMGSCDDVILVIHGTPTEVVQREPEFHHKRKQIWRGNSPVDYFFLGVLRHGYLSTPHSFPGCKIFSRSHVPVSSIFFDLSGSWPESFFSVNLFYKSAESHRNEEIQPQNCLSNQHYDRNCKWDLVN